MLIASTLVASTSMPTTVGNSTPVRCNGTRQVFSQRIQGVAADSISQVSQQQAVEKLIKDWYADTSLYLATNNSMEKCAEYRQIVWVSTQIHVEYVRIQVDGTGNYLIEPHSSRQS